MKRIAIIALALVTLIAFASCEGTPTTLADIEENMPSVTYPSYNDDDKTPSYDPAPSVPSTPAQEEPAVEENPFDFTVTK